MLLSVLTIVPRVSGRANTSGVVFSGQSVLDPAARQIEPEGKTRQLVVALEAALDNAGTAFTPLGTLMDPFLSEWGDRSARNVSSFRQTATPNGTRGSSPAGRWPR